MTRELGRLFILLGAALLLAGVALIAAARLGLGRLPGDFIFRRGNFTLYFPLMTSILLSLLASLLLWFFVRR
jgi:Protein of unknown function (DUF2905)